MQMKVIHNNFDASEYILENFVEGCILNEQQGKNVQASEIESRFSP